MERQTQYTLFMIFFAAIGGVLYGYDIGAITGAFLFIRHDVAMSVQEMSFVGGSVLFGGAFATLVTGPLSDWFGRRRMVLLAAVLFIVGVLLLVHAIDYAEVLIGRLTQGVGIGIITIAVPLYLAESVPSHIRGRAMSVFQLMLNGGILLATLIGLYFAPTHNWRAMFLSALVPGIIMLIGTLFLTDSPRWLVRRGRTAKALEVLLRSRNEAEAKGELSAIQASIHHSGAGSALKHLLQKRYLLPLLVVFAVAVLNQLTGINSIIQYSAIILKASGLHSDITDMLGSNAINTMNFLVVLIVILLVDKIGRRTLLSVGTGGIVLSLLIGGIIYHWMPEGALKGYLMLASILGYIFFYAIGPGVLVWLVLSELLPSRIRSTGMAAALFLNSMASAILASVYLDLAHAISYAGVFWFSAATTLVYFILALFVIPETKGKSLEEVESHFAH